MKILKYIIKSDAKQLSKFLEIVKTINENESEASNDISDITNTEILQKFIDIYLNIVITITQPKKENKMIILMKFLEKVTDILNLKNANKMIILQSFLEQVTVMLKPRAFKSNLPNNDKLMFLENY